MSHTDVATANVRQSLPRPVALGAVAAVLERDPDLVGLQEWYPLRAGLLRRGAGAAYHWHTPVLGGCAVGARRDRYRPLRVRWRVLSRPGRGDRRGRVLDPEPGRLAAVAVYHDLLLDRTVALVDYHLVSGVQSRDVARDDRPRLVARHRRESARLAALVAALLAAGHVVHAVGDANWHGFVLPSLTSAWAGREEQAGTLGPRRRVDDVFGPGPATRVGRVATASDHQALVVRRED